MTGGDPGNRPAASVRPTALVFRIHGLDCAEEAAALKREVGPVVGGEENLAFDYLNGRMIVFGVAPGAAPETPATAGDAPGRPRHTSHPRPTPDAIMAAVARAGMRAEPWRREDASGSRALDRARRARTLLTIASGACLAAGIVIHLLSAGLRSVLAHDLASSGFPSILAPGPPAAAPLGAPAPPSVALLYLLAVVTAFWLVAPKAWLALRRRRPDMNLLMTLAVLGAFAIGQWLEAASVAFLFALSLELESWSVRRARRAVAALLDLAPVVARLRRPDGAEELLPPEAIPVGALFVVKPGERIPLDGTVREGLSQVNQAPITGESLPVTRGPGGAVFAGTINEDGTLLVECTKSVDDTTLHHIILMVEEAHARRAPSERWVERFAAVYTPAILGLAALVLLVPPLLLHAAWGPWIYRSLVFLVIGCPCALVISTPVSIVAALAHAAHHGVLVKGGAALEMPARLKAVAFDKTGTLTGGRPVVTGLVPLNGHDEVELLERAAALESGSSHPMAEAVLACARERGVVPRPASLFQVVPGRGATALFDGQPFWLGSHRWLHDRGQEVPEIHEELEKLADAGHTVIVVGNEQHVCGFIAAADRVRPEARAALAGLKHAGIEHLIMLTGDNPGTAGAIARETGVDEVQADLLPEDKVATVERLVARYGTVAMVGDGVNDAPALARSSLGIAMGAAGSDAAIETADVALMSDDLSKLPWLVHHSRRTLRVIRQNVTFALSVKALFAALAFLGYASLWAAIAADMGASLLVIGNGLRLLRDPGERQLSIQRPSC